MTTTTTTEVDVQFDADIAKVDEDQRLVFGWANVSTTADGKAVFDRQGDTISIEELEKASYDYMTNSRDGGVMHIRKGVATLVECMVFTKEKMEKLGIPEGTVHEGMWVGFRVEDDTVWKGVKDGTYTQFSIHGRALRKHVEVELDTVHAPEHHERFMPIKKVATSASMGGLDKGSLSPAQMKQRKDAAAKRKKAGGAIGAKKGKAKARKALLGAGAKTKKRTIPVPKGGTYSGALNGGVWRDASGKVVGVSREEDTPIIAVTAADLARYKKRAGNTKRKPTSKTSKK